MKTRVLVIDDDHLVADTLSLIYNANGYECEARYSAADGFLRAKEFVPALMLCDITMPEETGLQLAVRVGEALPDTRLLMLTAYASNAAKAFAQACKTHQRMKVLCKPCRPEDLLWETQLLLQSV